MSDINWCIDELAHARTGRSLLTLQEVGLNGKTVTRGLSGPLVMTAKIKGEGLIYEMKGTGRLRVC